MIEDDRVFREHLEASLVKRGYTVETAGNGKEGLNKLKRFKPDVIVTDVLMPEMDGLELIRELRKHQTDYNIIVMSEGARGHDYLTIAKHFGAQGILKKPFPLEALHSEIEVLLTA